MNIGRQRGFSLLEMMISVAILSIVMAVIIEGISTMQIRNAVEVNRVDLTQQAREFMDQILNDLRQTGYPGLNMFDPGSFATATPAGQSSTDCTVDPNVACGFISVSSSGIQFEGDVDGTGVSEVFIELVTPASGSCPCTMRRGTVWKSVYMSTNPPQPPPFYTEVDNVMNSAVFTAYKSDGTAATLPASAGTGTLSNITAIGITLYAKSSQPDLRTGVYPTVTMVATAKITNVQSLQ